MGNKVVCKEGTCDKDSGLLGKPDYRAVLRKIILENFDSYYKFCKHTGIDEGFLSNVLNKKKSFSIEKLENILDKIGYVIEIRKRRPLLSKEIDQKRARNIMGRNMFGVEEAIKYFEINPSKHQLAVLSDIRFTETTLEICKETHVLVAAFPLSIIGIRDRVGRQLFRTRLWYNKESFANNSGGTNWQLVRKTAVPNSTSKTWSEQLSLLPDSEETPTAHLMAYTVIGNYLATGEKLLKGMFVRCSDKSSENMRVCVGRPMSDDLDICYDGWDGHRLYNVGLAAVRKFD